MFATDSLTWFATTSCRLARTAGRRATLSGRRASLPRCPPSLTFCRRLSTLSRLLPVLPREMHLHLASFLQFVHAAGYDHIAGHQARGDFGALALCRPHLYGPNGDSLVGLDQIHVRGLRISLHGGSWDQRHSLFFLHQEPRVHELAGKQAAVFVVEYRAQPERASRWINLV